ncbi:MAG: STAS domain-containing protein [Acidimicrobiales bacterium]|nr:STAS domain-containing protein [Acidimicrobiales bacterium]HLV89779.1 STAS domain-containing protein [Acidimicrobiia bacterium]
MPSANVTMTVREAAPRVRVVDIVGEITAFSEEEITRAHEEAARGGVDAVILNFEGLDYMNSGGIGLLVTTLIRAQRSGHRLLACGLTDHYRQILALTRIDEAIEVFDDEASAVAAV